MEAASERVLDALGDASRRRMLEVLRDGERPVGVLADALPIGRPAVSKHLAVLESAGLVTHRRAGTRHLYALAPGGLAPVQQWLAETWNHALDAFADYVETHRQDPMPDPAPAPAPDPAPVPAPDPAPATRSVLAPGTTGNGTTEESR